MVLSLAGSQAQKLIRAAPGISIGLWLLLTVGGSCTKPHYSGCTFKMAHGQVDAIQALF